MTGKPPTRYFEREVSTVKQGKTVRVYEPQPSKLPDRPAVVNKAVPEFEAMGMFMFSRPDHTRTEDAFIAHYLSPLGVASDRPGNCILRIGDAPHLFSCHTDTVARKEGYQKVHVKGDGFLGLHSSEKYKGKVLGGDDTVGVYLMCEMIKKKIPGLYIFHAGEELGGVGSRWLAKYNPGLVKGIKHAIAFDRRDYRHVITHMGSTRVCSDAFAKAFAAELNKGGLEYAPDDTGLFTDTRAYSELIPECTNISVGYFDAHGSDEIVDLRFLAALKNAILNVDWDKLPCERNPNVTEYKTYKPYTWDRGEYVYPDKLVAKKNSADDIPIGASGVKADMTGNPTTLPAVVVEGASHAASSPWTPKNGKQATNLLKGNGTAHPVTGEKVKNLEQMCDEYPEVAAAMLEEFGVDVKAFITYIAQVYETPPFDM